MKNRSKLIAVSAAFVFIILFIWAIKPSLTTRAAFLIPDDFRSQITIELIKRHPDIRTCNPHSKPFIGKIRVLSSKSQIKKALLLPDGTILLPQEVIKKTKSPAELSKIVLHEEGHDAFRHILQKRMENAGISGLLKVYQGNFDQGLLQLLSHGSLDTEYGKDFEKEADLYATGALKTKTLSFSDWKTLQIFCDPKPEKAQATAPKKSKSAKKTKKNDSLPPAPRDDLRQRFQFPQRF